MYPTSDFSGEKRPIFPITGPVIGEEGEEERTMMKSRVPFVGAVSMDESQSRVWEMEVWGGEDLCGLIR